MNVFSGVMLLASVLVLTGCDNSTSSQEQVMSGKTMGTVWRVSVAGVPAQRIPQLDRAIRQQLQQDDQQLSTWKTDSALSRFNQYQGTQPWPVSEEWRTLSLLRYVLVRKPVERWTLPLGLW